MRQQQQRSRNRNRGRKSSNPLSRNFESNGPDVKIRGNANHIAEKYSVLARDALTSGDTVMAENYFQHAEHYFRIVASAQQNSNQNNNQQNRNLNDGNKNSKSDNRGDGPQPELDRVPAEVAMKGEIGEENSDEAPREEERSRSRRNGRRPASNRRTSRASSKKDNEVATSKPADEVEGLSKDAASLPSGLIGKAGEEESQAPVRDE